MIDRYHRNCIYIARSKLPFLKWRLRASTWSYRVSPHIAHHGNLKARGKAYDHVGSLYSAPSSINNTRKTTQIYIRAQTSFSVGRPATREISIFLVFIEIYNCLQQQPLLNPFWRNISIINVRSCNVSRILIKIAN